MRGEEVRPTKDLYGHDEWEEEKNYIMNNKINFYQILLKRINNNLQKRNLDPIFKIETEVNRIGGNDKKIDENNFIENENNNYNFLNNENKFFLPGGGGTRVWPKKITIQSIINLY